MVLGNRKVTTALHHPSKKLNIPDLNFPRILNKPVEVEPQPPMAMDDHLENWETSTTMDHDDDDLLVLAAMEDLLTSMYDDDDLSSDSVSGSASASASFDNPTSLGPLTFSPSNLNVEEETVKTSDDDDAVTVEDTVTLNQIEQIMVLGKRKVTTALQQPSKKLDLNFPRILNKPVEVEPPMDDCESSLDHLENFNNWETSTTMDHNDDDLLVLAAMHDLINFNNRESSTSMDDDGVDDRVSLDLLTIMDNRERSGLLTSMDGVDDRESLDLLARMDNRESSGLLTSMDGVDDRESLDLLTRMDNRESSGLLTSMDGVDDRESLDLLTRMDNRESSGLLTSMDGVDDRESLQFPPNELNEGSASTGQLNEC